MFIYLHNNFLSESSLPDSLLSYVLPFDFLVKKPANWFIYRRTYFRNKEKKAKETARDKRLVTEKNQIVEINICEHQSMLIIIEFCLYVFVY